MGLGVTRDYHTLRRNLNLNSNSISDSSDITLSSGAKIYLNATTDVVIPQHVGLHFTDGNEKIESGGTNLNILAFNGDLNLSAGIDINLTATSDVNIPVNVGLKFGSGEKIESDNADLTISSGEDIILSPGGVTNGVKISTGFLSIRETSSAPEHIAASGVLWVNNASPNELFFTDDAGNDIQLTTAGLLSPSSAVAADDIVVGDASVSLTTSTGSISIDSQASRTTVDGHTGVTIQSSDSGDIVIDAAASGDIIFKRTAGTEWLTFNTSDVIDAGVTPVSEIVGKSNQRLRIRSVGVQQNFQLFASNSLQLAHMIQDEDYDTQGTSIHRWRNNEGFITSCSYNNDPTITYTADNGRIHQDMHVSGFGIPDNGIVGPITADAGAGNSSFELHNEYTGAAMSTTDGSITGDVEFRETVYITPTVYLKNLQTAFKESQDWQDHGQVTDQTLGGIGAGNLSAQFRGSTSGLKCVIRIKTDSDGIPSVHGNLVNAGSGYMNYITVTGGDYNSEIGSTTAKSIITHTAVSGLALYQSVHGTGIPPGAYIGEIDAPTQFKIHTLGTEVATDGGDLTGQTLYVHDRVVFQDPGYINFTDNTCDYDSTGGSKRVVTHDANAGIIAGLSVSGTGLAVGSTIVNIDSSTQFTVSADTIGGDLENQIVTFTNFEKSYMILEVGYASDGLIEFGTSQDDQQSGGTFSNQLYMDMNQSDTHIVANQRMKLMSDSDHNNVVQLDADTVFLSGIHHTYKTGQDYTFVHAGDRLVVGSSSCSTARICLENADENDDNDANFYMTANGMNNGSIKQCDESEIQSKGGGFQINTTPGNTTVTTLTSRVPTAGTAGHGTMKIAPIGDLILTADYPTAKIVLDSGTGGFEMHGTGATAKFADMYAGMILGYTVIGLDETPAKFDVLEAMTVVHDDLKVSFVFPPSGKVEIFVSIHVEAETTRPLTFGLSTQSKTAGFLTLGAKYENMSFMGDETEEKVHSHRWYITGTAGDSEELWFAVASSTGINRYDLHWGGDSSAAEIDAETFEYQPFIMKATALPSNTDDGS